MRERERVKTYLVKVDNFEISGDKRQGYILARLT